MVESAGTELTAVHGMHPHLVLLQRVVCTTACIVRCIMSCMKPAGSMNAAGLLEISGHLEECQGLQVNVIVAWWAAGLADVTNHDCHAPLIGIGIAVASLQAMSLNMDLHAVQVSLMWGCKRHEKACRT